MTAIHQLDNASFIERQVLGYSARKQRPMQASIDPAYRAGCVTPAMACERIATSNALLQPLQVFLRPLMTGYHQ